MIMMPRSDSQKDRQEEVEKDFHEKIGIMSQLHRSLHEMGELDLSNKIRVWLFGLDIVNFDIVAKDGQIEFHVSTFYEYKDFL